MTPEPKHSATCLKHDCRLETLIESMREMYCGLETDSKAADGDSRAALRARLNEAQNEFASLIYLRLYRLVCTLVGQSEGTPTMGPTALVNEAYAKMLNAGSVLRTRDLQHFVRQFAIAVKHTWISYWRKKSSERRGGNWVRTDFDIALDYAHQQNGDLKPLFDAIDHLDDEYPRAGQVFHMRYFLMMTNQEIKSALNISLSTVESDLRLAKATIRTIVEDNSPEWPVANGKSFEVY
ncbi:MAG: ECF-type sigma factor [Pirellulaceae bacterium]